MTEDIIVPDLIPAADLSSTALMTLINAAYADYYLPVHIDQTQLFEMRLQEDIDFTKSFVAFVNHQPIGVALLSVRERQGWLSGVGVLPGFRRRGIARAVIRHIQNLVAELGLQTLWLEMLAQNDPGAALYQRLGFVKARDLLVLRAEAGQYEPAAAPDHIRTVAPDQWLTHYQTFHDVRIPWQRSLRSLQARSHKLHSLGYWDGARLIGYILYELYPDNHAIYDLAVDPAHPHRLDVAEALLLALHTYRSDLGGYIINVPAEDPLAPAFTDLHYRVWQRQHEMFWTIP
ncbi:MAG: GNAT family N-acetyltransferase [Anaerolineae bacterium]|nr:GNAT family N-acetyltransferase [Anaerolineae bacterium]